MIKIYYSDDKIHRPLGLNRVWFWKTKIVDSLVISAEQELALFESRLQGLKKGRSSEINCEVALVRYKDSVSFDMIYTDRFFQEWEISTVTYEDTTGFF